jgi:anti-anti-sigma factor
MALEIVTVLKGQAAEITLTGELDAAGAPRFRQELEGVAAARPRRLVLFLRGLAYIASAGIRTLIFARQQMGPGVDIYAIAPQEQVLDTLRRTGLATSVVVQEEYAAAG